MLSTQMMNIYQWKVIKLSTTYSVEPISLKANTEYTLNKQVRISKGMTFQSEYQSNVNESNVVGRKNAIIKMAGKDRIFQIERNKPLDSEKPEAMLNVSFTEISFKGCGQSVCASQGGLIYNAENVAINHGQLLNGYASQGGAIYNAGTYADNISLSKTTIIDTLIQNNKAEQGAAIYSEIPAYVIAQSLIRDNEATGASGAILETRDQLTEDAINKISSIANFGLFNSTIFNNKGYVIKVFDAMQVNNITMILNSMGLIMNAPLNKGYVANSILAQNGTQDCKIEAGGAELQLSNNLYSAGCAGFKSTALGNTQLIAGATTEGKCDYSSSGILCPFKENPSINLGYFLPRILPSNLAGASSLIVNHGVAGQDEVIKCSKIDQRGKSRDQNPELCDRGAIELVIDTTTITTVGEDIFYDQTAHFSIADQLQDGELVSAEQCKQIFNRDVDSKGQPWKIGCMQIQQTNTPSKGTLTLNQDGDLTYTPNGHWQGSDEFKINVVTTTTSFDKSANPYISIPARIVQWKPNDFKNDKVKVSGGSLGVLSLLGLIGLVGYRRTKYK